MHFVILMEGSSLLTFRFYLFHRHSVFYFFAGIALIFAILFTSPDHWIRPGT